MKADKPATTPLQEHEQRLVIYVSHSSQTDAMQKLIYCCTVASLLAQTLVLIYQGLAQSALEQSFTEPVACSMQVSPEGQHAR